MSYLEETRKYEKKMKQFFKQQKKIAMNKIEFNRIHDSDISQHVIITGTSCELLPSRNLEAEQGLIASNRNPAMRIDRYNVASHLNVIPGNKSLPEVEDKTMEGVMNFVRYRSLLESKHLNENEKQYLETVSNELTTKILKLNRPKRVEKSKNMFLNKNMGNRRSEEEEEQEEGEQNSTAYDAHMIEKDSTHHKESLSMKEISEIAEHYGISPEKCGYAYCDLLKLNSRNEELLEEEKERTIQHQEALIGVNREKRREINRMKKSIYNTLYHQEELLNQQESNSKGEECVTFSNAWIYACCTYEHDSS